MRQGPEGIERRRCGLFGGTESGEALRTLLLTAAHRPQQRQLPLVALWKVT